MKVLLWLIMMCMPVHADEAWPTFGNPGRFTEQSGEAIYRSVCAGCHMPDGCGASGAGTYPSLVKDPSLAVIGYPIAVVLKGQKAMPPFGQSLSNEQVAAVLTYVRSHFDNEFAGVLSSGDVAAER